MLDLDQARLDWIHREHFSQGQQVEVVEKQHGGEGKVSFEVGEGEIALRFKLSENGRFPCIKQGKAADGVILHFGRDKSLRALHLVELKSKVSATQWRDVKLQLQGALHNAHALLGVLGLDCPERIVCHTAYKQDALSQNPALLKAQTGIRVEVSEDLADWFSGEIEIDRRFPPLKHFRHERDARGNARVRVEV
ncbi:hypothetical protein [Thauera sp. SWB20]|uniref:hypothetical protein n=1 Tax=Thauera sp. SWB20 TaxID=1572758 RepID=UPI0005C22FC1|nr:hypothetical protein [Thauera sp. SWB20]